MARTDDQARNLAILLSNKLGEKSQLLGLPMARQAQHLCASNESDSVYIYARIEQWDISVDC